MVETISLEETVQCARDAARVLATLTTSVKNAILHDLADRVEDRVDRILRANAADMARADAGGMAPAMLDRLLLTAERVRGIAGDVRHVASLPDPVGEVFDCSTLPNGLEIRRQRVPLGVIGVIYEARPNVTVDVAALCLKSGNAVVLRGGKESRESTEVLVELIHEALEAGGVPAHAVGLVNDPDRALIGQMVRMRGAIDLVIPRGGKGLIDYVREHAQVPVVAGGMGVCHTYVHSDADVNGAVAVVNDAKTRRPTVCNALDTVLVHEAVADRFLPALYDRWAPLGVEMRCDARALQILRAVSARESVRPADPDDFGQEFLALRAAVRVVDDLDEAISHIETYGSGHSEAILTEGYEAAREFVHRIDAAAVYVNASTGFTDGAQFGLGAEIGISTQKFHARGPLGLRELTSYKWVVFGDGQIRG